MNTINTDSTARRILTVEESIAQPTMDAFRVPQFDSESLPDALKLEIFVPGVDAHGIEISISGIDLFVTAKKRHIVRTNWKSLHLEAAQSDYGLQLRLSHRLDLSALQADLIDGVLVINIPVLVTSHDPHRDGFDLAA